MARRRKPLEPIDAGKAAAVLTALRAGQNLDVALMRARLPWCRLKRWLKLVNDRRPAAQPYRDFAEAFGAALQSQRPLQDRHEHDRNAQTAT